MKIINLLLQICFVIGVVSTLSSQTFSCDGQLLVASNDSITTTIFRPIPIPFSPAFFSPVARYTNGSFDALGFNSKDNYIYGVQRNTNAIVRLKKDNTYEVIGTVPLVDTLRSYAGDCTPEGLYLLHDYELNQILVFEVADNFQLLDRVDLFWDPTSVNNGDFTNLIFDFAIDPNNPSFAYSYQGASDNQELGPETTRGRMLQINLNFDDPEIGMITPRQRINKNLITHLGGLVFSPQSDLFGYGTTSEGLNPKQNRLLSINAFDGDVSQVLFQSTAAQYSDGCSCPFSFTFTNRVPGDGILCNNDEKTFFLKIDNYTYIPVEDVILRDTFPEGIIIQEVLGDFEGNISTGAGVGIGTNILEITGLKVPAKTIIDIEVSVLSIDVEVGPIFNQAFLENLPARYNGRLVSNDPATIGIEDDPSRYYAVEQDLNDVSWQIFGPSDCINGDDAQIVFTSEQFFPGQGFEVGLRNQIGWEEQVYSVVIDQNNSFIIDSLIPGDYQIFTLRSLSENCSLKLRDTTILIEPPNDLLKLEASTNSPVCEGAPLRLNGAVSPAGSIRWTGPRSFGSDISNSIIEETVSNQSGIYKANAIYGFCTQEELLEVDIRPEVDASIVGKTELCVRDTLLLSAVGEGVDVEYIWNKGSSQIAFDSTLMILEANNDDSGHFEVIADNGACTDTVSIDVVVLPTPTLVLPRQIMSDFCSPIIFTPELSGDADVSYQWSPQEGLDCADCPYPQVQPLVQSSYQLRVENDYLCTDSATVNIILDKRKLIFTPNIFMLSSINGNDQFEITPGCIIHFIHSLDVYDRWGSIAYSGFSGSSDGSIGYWDGFINGKAASSGVYIWFAKVELVDGSIEYVSGDVTLLNE